MLLRLQLPRQVPKDAPLLVAYSGGADSRLLLALAQEYAQSRGISVYAAHLHHGIRGQEADRDLDFCRRTAKEADITLFEKHVDVPLLAKQSGRSLEAEAREQRYAFFEEVMSAHGIPVLLTAHHADDQLETLLHHFLRGTGTKGLAGIPEIRPLSYGFAVRPLLTLTKADILASCQNRALDYVTDSTNDSPFTIRNRIRKEIIPALEDLVGQGVPQQAAGRLARAAREDDDCLCEMAKIALRDCRSESGLCVSSLSRISPAIAKRMLTIFYNEAVEQTLGKPPDPRHTLTARHLEQLLALCQKAESGTSLDLPFLKAEIHKDALSFRPPEKRVDAPSPLLPIPLYEGDTPWDSGRILIRISKGKAVCTPEEAEKLIADAVFPADLLPLPLWARPRGSGDVITSHGMHKKLKKLLCDKGIPRHMRERLPLLCYGDDMTPLWYPTVAFADGFPPPSRGPLWHILIFEKSPKGQYI